MTSLNADLLRKIFWGGAPYFNTYLKGVPYVKIIVENAQMNHLKNK